ncbi:MAG TPA: AGE family epimerase/isomerase [Pseudorhizobium sp.]|nr:AGE family epimerase/isomerase [Pseudorhizobium sp.]
MSSAKAFATIFVPEWIEVARDRDFGGVVQRLDEGGGPVKGEKKTTLASARTVFSLAHLYLYTANPALLTAAKDINLFMTTYLRLPGGGYRCAVECDGRPSADPADGLCRAYDQSFALLALVTLQKADPSAVPGDMIADLWDFIVSITEPATGALYEDERMARSGAHPHEHRSQNPQMHMLEALLQAYEMSGERVWLERASRYVSLAEMFLVDPATGAVREYVGHDLSPLNSVLGNRREPGHQFEWAWLLLRYRELGGAREVDDLIERMTRFADAYGVRRDGGPMDGAPFDAVDAEGKTIEATHLLWPLTELGKLGCMQHLRGEVGAAQRCRGIERLIFERYFAKDRLTWVNQLDGVGAVLVPDALSRLIYHVLLFVTEGARAGLWTLRRNHS